MVQYFPHQFNSTVNLVFNTNILKKLEAEVDFILTGDEKYKADIYDKEREMLETVRPNIWNINVLGNMEIEMEVEFEKLLISVADNCNINIDNISVFRFYSVLEHLKEKNK